MAAFNFPDPTIQQTVTNPITGSTYQWKEPPGKWVVASKTNAVGALIWEGDNPPIPIADYKLWYSTDTLELYFYYCDANGVCAWLPTSVPIQVLEDLNAFAAQAEVDIDQLQYKQTLLQNALDQIYLDQQQGSYVKKEGGDTMEGKLIISGPRKAGDNVDKPDLVSSLQVLNIDNAQNSSLQLRHSGSAKVYIGNDDVSIASDVKFNRSQPTIVKTNVGELLRIDGDEIAYLGKSIEDEDLVTKKYVDDIAIELEEEIDAIAPSVERGKWRFTAVGTVAQPGQFTMYDDEFGSGSPTGLFKNVKSIWFNEIDSEGTAHAFGDVDDGELLEIFIDGSPEFGLYEVKGQAHDETNGASKFWVVDVNFVRTNEDTTAVTPSELCRFKVFMAPTGGGAGDFLMKYGDKVDDAVGDVEFKWNEKLVLNSEEEIELKLGERDSYFRMILEEDGDLRTTLNAEFLTFTAENKITFRGDDDFILYGYSTLITGRNNLRLETTNGDIEIQASKSGGSASKETLVREIDEIIDPKQITTKEYVDSKSGIQVLAGGPSNPKVGDAWFSTNQNVFIIKIS